MQPAVQLHEAIAAQWEGKYSQAAFASREQVITSALAGLAEKGHRWLDAGCGTGRFSRYLARMGCLVHGVDGSPAMLAIARDLARADGLGENLVFQQVATIESLPLPDCSFDGIICSSVIEYVDHPTSALAELARVLKPGGHLLVSAPNKLSAVRGSLRAVYSLSRRLGKPWPRYLEFSKHEFTRRSFQRLLSTFGLEVLHVVSFGGPLPAILQRSHFLGSLLLGITRKLYGGPAPSTG